MKGLLVSIIAGLWGLVILIGGSRFNALENRVNKVEADEQKASTTVDQQRSEVTAFQLKTSESIAVVQQKVADILNSNARVEGRVDKIDDKLDRILNFEARLLRTGVSQ